MALKLLPFYIIWIFLHVLLWAFAPHPRLLHAPDYFYPFSGELRHYDITEFLVYVGAPVVLYVAYRLYKKQEGPCQ